MDDDSTIPKMKITILIFFFCLLPFAFADLTFGFYSFSCPNAETIVREVVQRHFNTDRTITAALLRMHFHDCFVRGCDASILIDPVLSRNMSSEKKTPENLTVRGYELIDDIKFALEQACPFTVSCADIIALATRDAVALAGGPRYNVPTGRRDGFISNPSEPKFNIPGPFFTVPQTLQLFNSKGLTLEEMVTLLGAHTVGVAHCSNFEKRLSSFQGKPDPTMDPNLDRALVNICGSFQSPTPGDPSVILDEHTPFVFDNLFYQQILRNRAIIKFDQSMALDSSSRNMAVNFADDDASFQQSFANAIIKMGSIDVLVGRSGEIRNNCRVFNHPL